VQLFIRQRNVALQRRGVAEKIRFISALHVCTAIKQTKLFFAVVLVCFVLFYLVARVRAPLCRGFQASPGFCWVTRLQRSRGFKTLEFKTLEKAESCNFLTDRRKFPTEEIMAAKKFNCCP